MKSFQISIIYSSVVMGVYQGEDAEAAYDAMLKDAGYASRDAAARVRMDYDQYSDDSVEGEDAFYAKRAEQERDDADVVEVITLDVIRSATSLDDLCAALNAAPEGIVTEYVTETLPTFGGEEPASTVGIWSWDETRVLRHTPNMRVGAQDGDWFVEPRQAA